MFKKTKFVAHFFNISTKTKFVDTVKLWIFVQLCREDDQSISDACGSENVLKCNYNIFTKKLSKNLLLTWQYLQFSIDRMFWAFLSAVAPMKMKIVEAKYLSFVFFKTQDPMT